jgi:hypothetical protein
MQCYVQTSTAQWFVGDEVVFFFLSFFFFFLMFVIFFCSTRMLKWVMLLTCIQEVPYSHPGCDTFGSGFLTLINAEMTARIGQGHFLLNPLQFITQHSF